MATRLSQKGALASNTANDDFFMVVDKSDTTSSADGTSKKIDSKYIITTDTIAIANVDLSTTPKTLLSPPGAGFFYQPLTITVICTGNVAQNTRSNYLYVSYTSGSTTNYIVAQRDWYLNEGTNDRTYIFSLAMTTPADGTYAGSINNKGMYLYTSTDLDGDWASKCYITYQICAI